MIMESMPFGEKTYQVKIPINTPIFYISALDEINGMPKEETEQEFLLFPGTTTLFSDTLIYTPSSQENIEEYFLNLFS